MRSGPSAPKTGRTARYLFFKTVQTARYVMTCLEAATAAPARARWVASSDPDRAMPSHYPWDVAKAWQGEVAEEYAPDVAPTPIPTTSREKLRQWLATTEPTPTPPEPWPDASCG